MSDDRRPVIWKFPLRVGMNRVSGPALHSPLAAAMQGDGLMMWGEVSEGLLPRTLLVEVVPTGGSRSTCLSEHLATVVTLHGFVWHVFWELER